MSQFVNMHLINKFKDKIYCNIFTRILATHALVDIYAFFNLTNEIFF